MVFSLQCFKLKFYMHLSSPVHATTPTQNVHDIYCYSCVSVSPNSFRHQYLLTFVLWWIRAWHIQQSPSAVIHHTNLTFSRQVTFVRIYFVFWSLILTYAMSLYKREQTFRFISEVVCQNKLFMVCKGGFQCNNCRKLMNTRNFVKLWGIYFEIFQLILSRYFH
jgi:hypothetical protein